MAKKFPQMKRYGLEGAESMMVALDKLFEVSNKGSVSLRIIKNVFKIFGLKSYSPFLSCFRNCSWHNKRCIVHATPWSVKSANGFTRVFDCQVISQGERQR